MRPSVRLATVSHAPSGWYSPGADDDDVAVHVRAVRGVSRACGVRGLGRAGEQRPGDGRVFLLPLPSIREHVLLSRSPGEGLQCGIG